MSFVLRLLRSRSIGDRSFAFLHAHSISLVALRDDRCCCCTARLASIRSLHPHCSYLCTQLLHLRYQGHLSHLFLSSSWVHVLPLHEHLHELHEHHHHFHGGGDDDAAAAAAAAGDSAAAAAAGDSAAVAAYAVENDIDAGAAGTAGGGAGDLLL